MKSFLRLIGLLCFILPLTVFSAIEAEVNIAFDDNNIKQTAVIYVHGWNDDGALWSRYDGGGYLETSDDPYHCFPATDNFDIEPSPSLFLERAGIQNWAVQWWSDNDGNPFSTADDGWAFLSSANELISQSTWDNDNNYFAHNRPCPSALTLLKKGQIFKSQQVLARNTYNDSGRVVDHAIDLLEMLQSERGEGGKLENYRQINIVTHSKGSLVVRTMLALAAQSNREDYEFVANVIYNAPPFAGSSMGDLFAPLFGSETPSIVGLLNDPFFKAIFGTNTNMSVKTAISQYLDLVLINGGFSGGLDDMKNILPPGSMLALDLLAPFTLATIEEAINFLPPPNQFIPDFQVLTDILLNTIRNTVTAYTALPARPALDDLMMASAQERLLTYPTSNKSKQFIIYGDYDPANITSIGSPTTLFPCDIDETAGIDEQAIPCADEIKDNPDLLSADATTMQLTNSDIAVSVGSARLLAETDRFGEPMTVLAKVDGWHGDLTRPDMVGKEWLQALTTANTDMKLVGSIETSLKDERMYQVSLATTFSLVPKSTPINSSSRYATHTPVSTLLEYRVVKGDINGAEVSDWIPTDETQIIPFSQLHGRFNLEGAAFDIEWRSTNEKGGTEVIRSASFTLLTDLPKVIDSSIISPNSNEVLKRKKRRTVSEFSIRSPFLDELFPTKTNAITSKPEADWVVSNQATKALILVLDNFGDITYVWNEESIDAVGSITESNTKAVTLQLTALNEGYNTLLYRTKLGAKTSTVQHLSIYVDNNGPEVTFECQGYQSFTCLVGPTTPLRYTVHDLESNGGTGTLTSSQLANVDAGQMFSLGETNIAETGARNGIVGIPIDLNVKAIDLVNNVSDTQYTVYYDWTAPTIEIKSVDALPNDDGYLAFTSEVKVVVKVTSDNGGFSPPIANVIAYTGGTRSSPAFTLNGNGDYEAVVPLSPGKNSVQIATQDIVGNLKTENVNIEYSQVKFDAGSIKTLSPRIQDVCFNIGGEQINCSTGNIENVVTSYHGDVVAFRSRGNRFVANDTNNKYDVFVWRDGIVSRANTTEFGEQAVDGDSRSLAVSGNGRYVYFRSNATNLAENTDKTNLYIKDLETNKIALFSRDINGDPINRIAGAGDFEAVVTYSGRYVFFVSRTANYVEGITDPFNTGRDIYLVDLDPDANGNYFEDNYIILPISNVTDDTMANGDSIKISVSQNGKYLAFQTSAVDFGASDTERALVLIEFAGDADNGTLDTQVSNRKISVIALGGDIPKVGPNDDTVAFTTRVNIATDDNNKESTDIDIYVSTRNGVNNINDRTIAWVSQSYDGQASNLEGGSPILDLAIAEDKINGNIGKKIAWASTHTNIAEGDNNGVKDLFVYRESDTFPENLVAPNWVNASQPSTARVNDRSATLSPDGRYAFWVSQQEYSSPYAGDGLLHLIRRRIDQPIQTILTIETENNGEVQRSIEGNAALEDGKFLYDDEALIQLTAIPGIGSKFLEWQNVDNFDGVSATVSMAESRTVKAIFTNTNAPFDASATIETDEDKQSRGVSPTFSDLDINDVHFVSVVNQPDNGFAEVINNKLVYTPNENFVGNDSFTFQLTDLSNLQLAQPAIANVEITPVNDRPLSTSAEITTKSNQASVGVTPIVDDIDENDSFTYLLVSQPRNGDVTLDNNQLIFTPEQDYVGSDAFNYLAIDSGGLSVFGTANITVTAVREDPQDNTDDKGSTGDTSDEVTEPQKASNKSSGGSFGLMGLLLFGFLFGVIRFYSNNINPRKHLQNPGVNILPILRV